MKKSSNYNFNKYVTLLVCFLTLSCTERKIKVEDKNQTVSAYIEKKIDIPIPTKKAERVQINTNEYTDDFYYLYDKKNPLTQEYIKDEKEYAKYEMFQLLNIKKDLDLELKLRKGEVKKETIKISPEKNYLAYSDKYNEFEAYSIKIKNIKTGAVIQQINNVYGNIEWANDDKVLYYCTFEKNKVSKLYRYNLINNSIQLIYEEKNPNYSINLTKTISKSYIILNSKSKTANEILYIGARDQNNKLKVFIPRKEGVFYDIQHAGYKFIVLTNSNAPNYKIMAVNVLEEFRNTWENILSNNKNQKLNKLLVNKYNAIVFYTENNLKKIKVINLRNFKSYNLEFKNEINYDLDEYEEQNYNSNSFKFKFSSLTMPEIVYKYDTGMKILSKYQQQEIYNYNSTDYISKTISLAGKNGNISVSLISKKTNKNEPKILFNLAGNSEHDYFHPEIVSLLDRGYSVAYIHLAGGESNCQEWFDSKDINFKRDFIYDISNTIDYLVEKKYTTYNNVYAYGKSAGALALQILANLKPQNLNTIILNNPYAYDFRKTTEKREDMLHYQLKTAPYYTLQDKKYPNIFIQTDVEDLETIRYIAKTRTLKGNNSKISLKFTDKDNYIEYIANNYSFSLSN